MTSRKNSAPVRRGPLLSLRRRSPVWGGRPRPPNRPRPICLPLPFLPPTTRVEKSRARYDGALNGEWREVRTLVEVAGIYPPEGDAVPTVLLPFTLLSGM